MELEQTPDEAWLSFKDLFLTAADKHEPIVTRRVHGRSVPWLTPEIKDLMHKRDYEHKKAISTNGELHWSNYKRLRKDCVKRNVIIIPANFQVTRTLKKCGKHSTTSCLQKRNAQLASNLSATKFNEFFSSIARNLCDVFKGSVFPRILLPRVDKDFVLHAVETNFVCNELAELKLSKATGLDKISAKLLKDAASVIAKPVTYLINLTILTGEIPSQWKEARVTLIYKTGKKDD